MFISFTVLLRTLSMNIVVSNGLLSLVGLGSRKGQYRLNSYLDKALLSESLLIVSSLSIVGYTSSNTSKRSKNFESRLRTHCRAFLIASRL